MLEYDKKYQTLLKKILKQGIEEYSERTKHETKALPGETIDLDAGASFPILTLRRIPIRLFIAEQVWYLTGSRRPEDFLAQFTKIWDDFKEINGVVTAAYGYRWRHFSDKKPSYFADKRTILSTWGCCYLGSRK